MRREQLLQRWLLAIGVLMVVASPLIGLPEVVHDKGAVGGSYSCGPAYGLDFMRGMADYCGVEGLGQRFWWAWGLLIVGVLLVVVAGVRAFLFREKLAPERI
ncbi:hypothetical protein GIS00_05775 [Nakamurella sp. YIM 132087]|uniref:Uncharacterized protein n=1 Tax=Nakamurella alba TaxID=2665158 RepID=A0A7K1FJM0_9ACTN|nr:hypothetical protein [Nakamurella alba]MTD13453.1 hypothetical protein [Nakamurella alba]